MSSLTPKAVLVLPLGMLLAAGVMDVRARRIPNWLTLPFALSGMAEAAIWRGASGLGWSALSVAIVLAVLIGPFKLGFVGAADVKLLAAAAAWLAPRYLPALFVGTMVAGGVLAALAYLLSSRSARAEVRNNLTGIAYGLAPTLPTGAAASAPEASGRWSVPYGVAIGVVAAVLLLARSRA